MIRPIQGVNEPAERGVQLQRQGPGSAFMGDASMWRDRGSSPGNIYSEGVAALAAGAAEGRRRIKAMVAHLATRAAAAALGT